MDKIVISLTAFVCFCICVCVYICVHVSDLCYDPDLKLGISVPNLVAGLALD